MANGHGGRRAGAGRKLGIANRKTAEIADAAAAQGITPLEVMIEAMRELHAKGDKIAACAIAKDAAPYIHPRLANIALDATVRRDPIDLTEAELLAIAAGSRADGAAAETGEDEPSRLH
jgi:hypothetical protein